MHAVKIPHAVTGWQSVSIKCIVSIEITPIKQKGGKTVHAWAFQGNCDPTAIRSNTFTMEWPPKSGRQVEFPEVDRAEFFELDVAKKKINPAQPMLLDELVMSVAASRS